MILCALSVRKYLILSSMLTCAHCYCQIAICVLYIDTSAPARYQPMAVNPMRTRISHASLYVQCEKWRWLICLVMCWHSFDRLGLLAICHCLGFLRSANDCEMYITHSFVTWACE